MDGQWSDPVGGRSSDSIATSTGAIIQNIANLMENKNVDRAEEWLQGQYEKDCLGFMKQLFAIASQGGKAGRERTTQSILLYTRHFIYKQTYRMPDLLTEFVALHHALAFTQFRHLVTQCMRAYLGKAIHTPYTKDFLQQAAYELLQQLQTGQLTEEHLSMVVDTLSNLVECHQYRPGLSMEAERLIMVIVNNFSLKKPISISLPVWIEAILVLTAYGRCTPCCEFVTKAMRAEGLSIRLQTKICDVFNRISSKMGNLQQVYSLISSQMSCLGSGRYLQELDEECGIEGVETQLKTLLNMLKIIGRCIQANKCSGDINQHMLASYFQDYEFFNTCVHSALHAYEKYHFESPELSYTIIYIFEELLLQLIDEKNVVDYISKVKQTMKLQHIYLLLSSLPRSTMEIFSASDILVSQITEILNNSNNIEVVHNREHMALMELFLDFVLHYIAVYYYIQKNVLNAIGDLLQSFIMILPETPQVNRNALLLKAYGFSIVCRLQKYSQNLVNRELNCIRERVTRIFSMSYELIEKIINLQENSQQIVAIVMQGLSELKNLHNFAPVVYECLISFFNHYLKTNHEFVQVRKLQVQSLYAHLLKLLQQYFQCLIQSRNSMGLMIPSLLPILHQSLQTKNKALQDQACQLVLKILFTTNSQHLNQLLSEPQYDSVYESIYNTGVYQYIQQSFLKEDEDLTYCKILMETLPNEAGWRLVESLLEKVCKMEVQKKSTIVHNFDKIWEALVILYGVRNAYTELKQINQRIDKIMGGSLQALFMNMGIDEQKLYKKQSIKSKEKINWSWLPEVRRVLEPGSVVGTLVGLKLNQS